MKETQQKTKIFLQKEQKRKNGRMSWWFLKGFGKRSKSYVLFEFNIHIMEIKHFDKPGYLAWSNSKNHSELLASASFADTNGFYSLDILEIDLQERSKKINVIGTGYTDTPFRCVAWDNFGEKQNAYPNGLIFTGMEDGSFQLWNPNLMITSYPPPAPTAEGLESQVCTIYKEEAEEEQFPVMCAEWNNLKNNFLAFGGTDVLLLNVGKDPSDPEISKPGKKNPHAKSYVTSVSWNREVPHILASASENGLVALWDIKTNNSIFQFKDSGASSGDRNVAICWSKSISTQIAVTLDDDKRNQLQIWDLRNQKGPVVVIDKIHTKGINAMDWCETDPELILTASRDNRIACWNYTQEETPLSQSQIQGGVYNLKWSKKLPSIYAVSNEEKTSVFTLSDNLFGYVPKWYKVPVGATLLGSEASLTYSQQRGAVLHESKLPHHPKNQDLKTQLKALSNVLQGIFDQKQNDSELSNLIKSKTSNQADSGIYDYLGFNKEKIVHEVQKYTGKKRQFAIGPQKNVKEKNVKPKAKAYTQIQGQDALAFFAEIGNKTIIQPAKQQDSDNNEGQIKYDMVPRNFNWDKGKERLVKQNILIGNYEGAIDAALKCGRTAEALIIAYSVDQNLFSTTLKTFFTETTDNFITDVLKCIAYRDAIELINKYDLQKWKQCISLIYSMSSRDKRPQLLKLLAERLIKEKETAQIQKKELISQSYAPIICYILADDFQKIAEIYFKNLSFFKSGSLERKRAVLEYTRRLVTIFEGLTVEVEQCKEYLKMLRESMFVAIQQGQSVIAHSICTRLPNNGRMVDYLTSTSKELQRYKSSVSYKNVFLPIMQPKKIEKKGAKPEQVGKQAHKKGIFPPKEDDSQKAGIPHPPPPPGPKRRTEDDAGFSPYEGTPAEKPVPVKKNLNTPPPPPPGHTKKIHSQQPVEEQPEEERPQIPIQPPPQHKKVQPPPPPPPPPPSHQAQHTPVQPVEEQQKSAVKPPPPKSNPPPPPPFQGDRRPPPQVIQQPKTIVTHQSPPPPPPSKHEYEQNQQPEQKFQPIPPPSVKKKMPPPPPSPHKVVPEPDSIPTKQQYVQPPPPPKRTLPQPPIKKQMQLPPPPKVEEQKSEPVYEQPVRRTMPPPVVSSGQKRTPPPPPVRR